MVLLRDKPIEVGALVTMTRKRPFFPGVWAESGPNPLGTEDWRRALKLARL